MKYGVFTLPSVCCLISGLFEAIFYHLRHSSRSPLSTAQRERRKTKGGRSMQKRSHFYSQGAQMDHCQTATCYNQQFQPFSVNQGCDFYRTQPAAVYAFGLPSSIASPHNQKLFLLIVLLKCHVVYCF